MDFGLSSVGAIIDVHLGSFERSSENANSSRGKSPSSPSGESRGANGAVVVSISPGVLAKSRADNQQTPATDAEPPENDSSAGSPSKAESTNASNNAAGSTSETEEKSKADPGAKTGPSGELLTEEELQKVEELKKRDGEVRRHEQAHLSGLGRFARSGPSFKFETGPDGRRYAVGGEVAVDVSEGRSPQETVQKAQAIRRAALAPVDPSAQDRAVASQAQRLEQRARAEVAEIKREERAEETKTEDSESTTGETRETSEGDDSGDAGEAGAPTATTASNAPKPEAATGPGPAAIQAADSGFIPSDIPSGGPRPTTLDS